MLTTWGEMSSALLKRLAAAAQGDIEGTGLLYSISSKYPPMTAGPNHDDSPWVMQASKNLGLTSARMRHHTVHLEVVGSSAPVLVPCLLSSLWGKHISYSRKFLCSFLLF